MRDWREERADQDGSASDRSVVGGPPRGRRQGADLGRLRLPLAGDQLHAAPALERRRQIQPAHARQGDRLLHSRACRSSSCAPPGCARSAAASASTRPRARPSCIWIPAACGTGRACRRSSSRACWRRASSTSASTRAAPDGARRNPRKPKPASPSCSAAAGTRKRMPRPRRRQPSRPAAQHGPPAACAPRHGARSRPSRAVTRARARRLQRRRCRRRSRPNRNVQARDLPGGLGDLQGGRQAGGCVRRIVRARIHHLEAGDSPKTRRRPRKPVTTRRTPKPGPAAAASRWRRPR